MTSGKSGGTPPGYSTIRSMATRACCAAASWETLRICTFQDRRDPGRAPAASHQVGDLVGQSQPTPSADETHPQLLAIGAPVHVTLPHGTAVITVGGPTENLSTPAPAKPPTQVDGTITISVSVESGTVTVRAADLSSRDDHGNDIALSASGPETAKATPGNPATLSVHGVFQAGAAQVTLRQDGQVVAVWDFNIELD